MSRVSPGVPARVPLLTAAIDDETFSPPVDCSGLPHIVIYIIGDGTTSSGVITIEEADWDGPLHEQPYGGTWSSITTVNASDVSGGIQKAVHLTVSAYAYVRARISTVIGGGGSVSVVLRAN